MARGKRSHPTGSLGIRPRHVMVSNKTMPEINTVHAFGPQGNETSGWPFRPTAAAGTLIVGTGYRYRPPRMTKDDLGGSKKRSKSKR